MLIADLVSWLLWINKSNSKSQVNYTEECPANFLFEKVSVKVFKETEAFKQLICLD